VTTIAAYADWDGLDAPLRLGLLHARAGAGREVFEFEFDPAALAHPFIENIYLDPRISSYTCPQHPPRAKQRLMTAPRPSWTVLPCCTSSARNQAGMPAAAGGSMRAS